MSPIQPMEAGRGSDPAVAGGLAASAGGRGEEAPHRLKTHTKVTSVGAGVHGGSAETLGRVLGSHTIGRDPNGGGGEGTETDHEDEDEASEDAEEEAAEEEEAEAEDGERGDVGDQEMDMEEASAQDETEQVRVMKPSERSPSPSRRRQPDHSGRPLEEEDEAPFLSARQHAAIQWEREVAVDPHRLVLVPSEGGSFASSVGSGSSDITGTESIRPRTVCRPRYPRGRGAEGCLQPPYVPEATHQDAALGFMKEFLGANKTTMSDIPKKQDGQHSTILQLSDNMMQEGVDRVKDVRRLQAQIHAIAASPSSSAGPSRISTTSGNSGLLSGGKERS